MEYFCIFSYYIRKTTWFLGDLFCQENIQYFFGHIPKHPNIFGTILVAGQSFLTCKLLPYFFITCVFSISYQYDLIIGVAKQTDFVIHIYMVIPRSTLPHSLSILSA